MSLKEEYSKETFAALEKCQFIEDKLKDCILKAIEINKISNESKFAIKCKVKDIHKKPLGPLIKEFEKLNDNTELNNKLWNFKNERNDIVHASQIFTLGELEDKDHMLIAIEKMRERTNQASYLHEEILKIFWKLIRQKKVISRQQ